MRQETEDTWSSLMCAANAGDAGAYRQLLASLAEVLRAYIRRRFVGMGASPDEAEDVVQETLLAIHLKRHTWDAAQPLGPWVRAIARYKLVDHLRKRGPSTPLPIDDFADFLASEDRAPEILPQDAEKLLAGLSGRQRKLVQLATMDGLTSAEIATRLGMTEGAVRVALHRSLKSLAATWREIGE